MAAEKPALDFDGLRPPSPFLTPVHDAWRQQLRAFVEQEIAPNLKAWDAASTFPDDVYTKAAAAGVLGMGFDKALGGTGEDIDLYHRIIFAEEFFRMGSGVVFADLATHWIALPPVIAFGPAEMLERVARPVLAGEKKMAFAVTEPSGGSDVGAFQTTAEKRGDTYVVNGGKTLISGATRADFMLTAVRTGGPGVGGLSLLLIEADRPGVSTKPVEGLEWYNRNNGSITFENVEVPTANLIGVENRGFAGLANQFNIERFSGISATLAMARTAIAEAIAWARERQTFGQRLIDHQAIRQKIVQMIQRLNAAYAYMDMVVWRFHRGETPVADLAMLKVQATTTLEHCARESLQVLGGRAYTGDNRVERIYREARIFVIGGGSEEILRDLAGRQLGF
ncbi:MAG: acyl-CoA dehydrogenase family protein [Alphaproteobacteria bacterium]|nr:acyl-CoA dehydrogenase family protein [Alphaproteobacteria bacterium]MBU1512497.1 acyl-CoA dehydrogenase family protein [Alphaproteobacteria bacterium]MBU2096579.1 acyl-CoA dehydrogenase family protein [Alphaproteobacteria bacterium]MBU2151603.1 acyl-CoA dehydrogenase family protein [Alphaproteobacteria bacterium]MBU2307321.1 acyl-CoA dehydrogenase family protein [Alphaproteobacteria bacterium]